MSFAWILGAVLVLFAGSQIYWFSRAHSLIRRKIPNRITRWVVELILLAVFAEMFALNFGVFGRRLTSTSLTLYDALVIAPFEWWAASSIIAFLLAMLLWPLRRASRAVVVSPGRRQFLERSAAAVVAAPFVAGAYGLFYGRLNLQTPTQRIRLARLPKAFDGFRIAQLSDIHIGPFMTQSEIRKYVEITNSLKPDLVALTGDFLTWDPSTQRAVVAALSGLHAPFGVFGCLGNHEAWSNTEESITALFAQTGVRILRQARVPITSGGENFNLIGVDFQTRRRMPAPGQERVVHEFLEGAESLVSPDMVNILMSHNPDTFDQAAQAWHRSEPRRTHAWRTGGA